MDKKREEEAYARMARLCSQRECAPSDIAGKLRKADCPEPDKVIARLREEGYIDERRYIRSYISDKLRFAKWGRKKITLFLHRKRLPCELIEEAFAKLDGDAFGESLLPLLEKKWKTVTGRTDHEKRGKLIRYALGRGFSMDEAAACIKKMRIGEGCDEAG
jgi:regulatory protein